MVDEVMNTKNINKIIGFILELLVESLITLFVGILMIMIVMILIGRLDKVLWYLKRLSDFILFKLRKTYYSQRKAIMTFISSKKNLLNNKNISSEKYFEEAKKLLYGVFVQQNIDLGIKYLKKSCDMNNTEALIFYGILCTEGKVVIKDYQKAKECFEKAADLGNSEGYNEIGIIYVEGMGIPQDKELAKEYFEKAANLGNKYAYMNLSDIYYIGIGTDKDVDKAIFYLDKAAELNHVPAINTLGCMYYDGKVVSEDLFKAKKYFEKAAEFKFPAAIYNLGLLYEYGYGDTVFRDIKRALKYYKKAAEWGNPSALKKIGYFYSQGEFVKKDYEMAFYYYNKAALNGDLESMYVIGQMYFKGEGVSRNYIKAYQYFDKLYKITKDRNAAYFLGFLHQKGLGGVNLDYELAKKYYKEAIEMRDPDSMVDLGYMYMMGIGVAKDLRKARVLLTMAIINGKRRIEKYFNKLEELEKENKYGVFK